MAVWGDWENWTLVDLEGREIGKIDAVLPEQDTDRLAWVVVSTDLGPRPAYLPDSGVVEGDEEIAIPYVKETVRTAPEFDLDSVLDEEIRVEIARHFKVALGPRTRPPPRPSELQPEEEEEEKES